MCPSHRNLSTDDLEELAAQWNCQLPGQSQLTSSVTKDRETSEEGQTPPAYRAERYTTAGEKSGEGTRRRAEKGEDGRRRNLVFPPAPEPLPYPVIDNHTHMDLYDGAVAISAKDALDTGEALGISGIVQVGCDIPSSLYAVCAARADSRVLAAVALHPNEAPRLQAEGRLDEALAAIDTLAAHPRVRALGETGLDYFRTEENGHRAQQQSFREHIRLAKKHRKALQIHDRDAHDDLVKILLEEDAPETTVFHCYSGNPQLAELCNTRGWYMSFSGTVTFKNAHSVQESLRIADPQLILAETDAPFLTPHPYRGRPNASYMTNYTVRYMADELGVSLENLCRQIAANSQRVYGSWA